MTELHGIFQIDSRDIRISEDVFARCQSMANVVELALGNAIAHEELEVQASTDPLTGVSNRRGLSLYLEGDRRHDAMSILVLDIDHLKAINDAHGHDVGDKILVAVASAVAGVLRGAIFWPGPGATSSWPSWRTPTSRPPAVVADRVTAAVARIEVQGSGRGQCGFASCGKNGDVDRAAQQADKAMYEAKQWAAGTTPAIPG